MPTRKADDERDADLRRLGSVIARHREKSGKSQESVAEAAGVTERYIRTVERGRASPSYRVLIGIAKALGVSLPDLIREAL